jgi:UTP--glucose-1-phosphate uridylyltransferase
MPSSLSEVSTPPTAAPTLQELAELIAAEKAFENTSTNVAASQMRNALNSLADTVKDEEQKKVRIQR